MRPSLEEKPNALYIAVPIDLKWLYKISRKLGRIFFLHVPRRLCKFFQSETNGGLQRSCGENKRTLLKKVRHIGCLERSDKSPFCFCWCLHRGK